MLPKDMLLFYSYSQMKGISEKREREYWQANEHPLLHEGFVQYFQQSIFDVENDDPVFMNRHAMETGDVDFFSKYLAKKNYYRIAYSFPDDVMFLDIETTGLSTTYHYVTMIGWIQNGKYHYWLQGMNPSDFLNAFASAKMIITFNGTKFDCKFLDSAFQSNSFSEKPNLDLMYLCRRFNLMGGQKEIEKEVGFSRPNELMDTDGKEAIAMWYSFLFGEDKSVQRLITYNYYDVIGMLYILDWLFFERIYGKEFPYKGKPFPFFSNSFLHDIRIDALPSAFYNSIRKYVKTHISNFSKNQLSLSHKFRVVGIDLAGKVDSRTGLCLLINSVAKTTVAHTDYDIIEFIRTSHPDLISIDAPLSLPKGRNSVYDDDSTRVSAGIMRYCERVLKTRNVNCYPALIRSMQELTKRGIKLAELFRSSGYPVIECFPGAAQDVIQLPRKRTDETLLKHGLSEFGIKGDFRSKKVCHDELDAITAALVGQFFISEFYEPLGIPEENDMIIPRKERTIPRHSIVIGLAGPIATGKTEAGRWIESLGFHYIRYSQIIEKKLIDSNNKKVTRNDLRCEGWNVYSGCRQYQLNQRLSEAIFEYSPVVIDGMRHLEDFTYWKESGFLRFVLVYIDSDRELRKQRFESRSDDSVSYDVAVSHPVEAHVELLRNKADYVVHNNGSIDDLRCELNAIISKIIKSQKSLAMTI